jgi:hypothetical protein
MGIRLLFICLALLLPPALARAADSASASPPISQNSLEAPEGSPEWVKKTLENNDSGTVVALGINYLLGKGVLPDGKKAVSLFASAAAVGDPLAECYMGIAFADGTGVPKNGAKAMDWFRAAARDGCPAAFDCLGHGFETGLEGRRDLKTAFRYYEQSAALGYPTAQWDVGVARQEGRGTEKDLVEALKWLVLADESGVKAAIPRRGEIEAMLDVSQKDEGRRRARSFKPDTNFSIAMTDSKPVTVPMGDYFQVPVKVFGDTKNLILDTGSDFAILEDGYKRRLPSLSPMARANDAPSEPDFEPRDCPEVFISGRRFAPLMAVAADIKDIQHATGEPINGILGMSCLKSEVVYFDSDNGQATIGGPVPESLKKNAMAVPLARIINSTYGIRVFINGRGPVFLAMDSGDAGSITLNDSDLQTVFGRQPKNTRSTSFVAVDGKIYEEKSVRLRTLGIGTNVCANLIAACSKNPRSYSRFGQHFIRRFLCAVDFPNRMLYLAPGKSFAVPDEYDMSGLSLLDIGGKIIVYSVAEDSPAFAAGIRANDQLLSINGQKTSSLHLKSIREILKSKPGDDITLEIKHDADNTRVKFQLKRLL